MSKREPSWIEGVPYCNDRCQKYDGKRCDEMGRQPDSICEPEVKDAFAELTDARKVVEAARSLMASWDDLKVDEFEIGRREVALNSAMSAYDANRAAKGDNDV